MKNILKNLSIILLLILIIINRSLVINAIIEAINIWLISIFPALFPFFIISDLILSSNLINIITNLIGPTFSYLFKTSKYASYVFIMGLISGCPSNAKYIKDLLDNGLMNKDEASKILAMSMLYNPLLILTITSYLSRFDAYFILGANIFINLIIGLINRKIKCDYNNHHHLTIKPFNLINTIAKTIDTLLLILGCLVFFIALSSLINIFHPLTLGIFEIVNGIKAISSISNYHYQLIFTGILLAFGGLSIQTQIKSILKDYKLEYSLFYKSRIIHLVLFILIINIRIIFIH